MHSSGEQGKTKCYVSERTETKSSRETQTKTDERATASTICTDNTIGIRSGWYIGRHY